MPQSLVFSTYSCTSWCLEIGLNSLPRVLNITSYFSGISQVLEIAKDMTGTNYSAEAVALFRKMLNSTESFFNDAPIPKNESNKEAHKKCSNLKGAERYCPKRWAAMQLWFKEARKVGGIFYNIG